MNSNPISRFIADINSDFIEHINNANFELQDRNSGDDWSSTHVEIDLSVGDKVKHEYFGIGKVKYLDDDLIEIDFGPTYGVKELMLEYARLEKL